jgi:hypothetical protein
MAIGQGGRNMGAGKIEPVPAATPGVKKIQWRGL